MEVAYDASLASTSVPLPTNLKQSTLAFTAIVNHLFDKSLDEEQLVDKFQEAGIFGPELDEEGVEIQAEGGEVSPLEFWQSIDQIVAAAKFEDAEILTDNLFLNLSFSDENPLLYFDANARSFFTINEGNWRKKFDPDPPLPIEFEVPPTEDEEEDDDGDEEDDNVSVESVGEDDEVSEVEESEDELIDEEATSTAARQRRANNAFLDSIQLINGPQSPELPIASTSTSKLNPTQISAREKADKIFEESKLRIDTAYSHLPENVQITFLLYQRYRDLEKDDPAEFDRRITSDGTLIPHIAKRGLLFGKGLDFKKVMVLDGKDGSTTQSTAPITTEELSAPVKKIFGIAELASRQLKTYEDWDFCFTQFQQFHEHNFPHLTKELAAYKQFILSGMRISKQHVPSFILFDRKFREKLISPSSFSNSYLDAQNDPLFILTISTRMGRTVDSDDDDLPSTSNNKRKGGKGEGGKNKKSSSICRNFNTRGCDGCERIHRCDKCESKTHGGSKCNVVKREDGVGNVGPPPQPARR